MQVKVEPGDGHVAVEIDNQVVYVERYYDREREDTVAKVMVQLPARASSFL